MYLFAELFHCEIKFSLLYVKYEHNTISVMDIDKSIKKNNSIKLCWKKKYLLMKFIAFIENYGVLLSSVDFVNATYYILFGFH